MNIHYNIQYYTQKLAANWYV